MGIEQSEQYSQPTFEGLQTPETEEIELANCLILDTPRYTATEKHKQWHCAIHAQPSIFQPDMDEHFIATASSDFAIQARKESLKPGDRAAITGVRSSQTIEYADGRSETIHKIALTNIQAITRETRVSTTVYAQKQKR